MSGATAFDKLVRELSQPDRQEMLYELQRKISLPHDPLVSMESEEEKAPLDIESEYQKFSFFEKIIVFLKKLFTGRSRQDVVQEILVTGIGRQISQKLPAMIDVPHRLVLSPFFNYLDNLRRSAQVFKEPLNRAMSHRQEFVAFLGGIEFKEIVERIQVEIDPWEIYETNKYHTNQEIKEILESRFDVILEEIHQEDRKRVYQYIRSLDLLHRLGQYPLDSILSQFHADQNNLPVDCSLDMIGPSLAGLGEIIGSLTLQPSFSAVEALVLYDEKEYLNRPDFNLSDDLEKRMKEMARSMEGIEAFVREVPLTALIRFAQRNVLWQPGSAPAGENWFHLFKEYWKRRVNDRYRRFTFQRELREMEPEIKKYFDHSSFPLRKMKGLPFHRSLSFLSLFIQQKLIPQMNYYLKIILVEGEFYKSDNRKDFTEAYNRLVVMKDDITPLISPDDPPSADAVKEEGDSSSIPSRGDLIDEAERLSRLGSSALETLNSVIKGILSGNGGKYDSLSNIDFIGGSENKAFRKELAHLAESLERAQELMNQLYQTEANLR